MLVTYT